MIKKNHIVLFLLILGVFLLPSENYACVKSKATTSCEKSIADKDKKEVKHKNCCTDNPCSKKDQHRCNGKCDHSNCTASSIQFSLQTTNEIEFHNYCFNFSLEKPVPYYKNRCVSDGYTSIWTPPKITQHSLTSRAKSFMAQQLATS